MAASPPDGPSGADAPSTSKGKKNVSNEKESPRRASVSALQNEHHINVQQNSVAYQIVQNNNNVRNPVNNDLLHAKSTLGDGMDMGDPNGSLSSDYNDDDDQDDIVDSDGPQDDISLGDGCNGHLPGSSGL